MTEKNKALNIHLADIVKASNAGKEVVTELMVSSIGESFLVPRVLNLKCLLASTCDLSDRCPWKDGKERTKKIPDNNALYIELTRTPSHRFQKIFTKEMRCYRPQKDRLFKIDVQEHVTVQEVLAIPKVKKVTSGKDKSQVDESGHEYKERLIYCLGSLDSVTKYYRAKGTVIPSPKGQEATMLVAEMEPIEDDYEKFNLTDENRESFKLFQVKKGQKVIGKVKELAQDITDNLTKIYGIHRERALFGDLLVYHSIIKFSFDGELLKRGWVEKLEIGDTGEGKTQIKDRIIMATELGVSIDGVSSTRTGISYSYQQYGKTWYLVWGMYPLNDRRLLFVDEAQMLKPADIDNIRKGRSEGILNADGIKKGEHPCRTRLIFSCNPKYSTVIDDEMFGIETIKQIFRTEDIRRFDFAILLSSSDQDKDEVNQLQSDRLSAKQRITPEILRNSICWAWTRKPEDVVFTEEATKELIEVVKRLHDKYGSAKEIPLVSTDIRHKVARLSVALAALLHSTDEAHQEVIVKPEHPLFIESYLNQIYSHPNCGFNLYAQIKREEAVLGDEDYKGFLNDLGDSQGSDQAKMDMLKTLISHNKGISRNDLAQELGVAKEYISTLVQVLKQHRLIKVNRGRSGGYKPTSKFVKILRRMVKEGSLVPCLLLIFAKIPVTI